MNKQKNNTYTWMISLFVVAVLFGGVITGAFGENITNENETQLVLDDGAVSVTLPVGTYTIETTDTGDIVTVENYGRLKTPGEPNLPTKIFHVAIPPGSNYVDMTVETGEPIVFDETYFIQPVTTPIIIGEDNPEVYAQMQQTYDLNYQSTYTSDDSYPASIAEFVQTSGYRKYNLVDIQINPFSYRPASGQLTYYSDITVTINYEFPEGFKSDDIMIDNIPQAEQKAQQIISNYNQAKEWYPESSGNRDNYDYVIITLDSLTSAIQSLENWETAKGRSVNVVTTSWINSNYAGYDLAEKIRNFLIEKYPSGEWGILDVCLIGHWDDVPIRTCSQYYYGYGPPDSDFYYAELTKPDSQSWDSNGNHLWAEDSDPIDFVSEVNVGRIPWSNPTIVEDICDKSVAYEQNDDPSFKQNILLLGAFFWWDTDNAVLMEYKTDASIHPWMTDWTMTKMYEVGDTTYQCDYNLDYNNVKQVWSQGTYAFVDWAGHGSPTACYEYYPYSQPFVDTDTCNFLNDDYPSIIFADACSNSDTDYQNIGQTMLKQGGVGFLGSTKVAFGMHAWNDPTDGSSQSLDYFFTTCCTSGNYTQGQAHQYALHEMYTNNYWYDSKFEALEWGAFWGQPDLSMSSFGSNLPPEIPAIPSGATEGGIGIEYTYTTSTTDPEGSQVYYMWAWGDEGSDWLGPYDSGETVSASHIWDAEGVYSLRVKAKDAEGRESDWSTPLEVTITADAIIEIGDIKGGFGISTEILNVGAGEAENVDWSIAVQGGLVLLGQETTGTLETVMPGFSPDIQSGLIFGIGNIQISITAADKEKTASALLIGPFVLNVS